METDKGKLTIMLKGREMQEALIKLGNEFLNLQQEF